MPRARAKALLALTAIAVTSIAILVGESRESRADLENQLFTSRADKLKLVVPRGWVATEQPSYPGLLLSMLRDAPEGRMVLTAESFTRDLYCSWPVACRTSRESLPTKYACALRQKLGIDRKLRLGPVQAGPKENEEAGLPSVWFEYDDGKHFVRQAVALTGERVISLLLVTATSEARNSLTRAFEQALRTTQILSEPADIDAGVPVDALPDDAIMPVVDGARLDAGVMFESAPAPKINPIGTCP